MQTSNIKTAGLTKEGSRPVSFRLTLDDYAAYKSKFAASGMTQSEFFREHVLNNTTKVVAKSNTNPDLQRLVFLFKKASNNINQLAHRANAENLSGVLSDTTFAAIASQLKQLNAFLAEQVKAES
jgi:hypothetical protein